MNSRPSAHPRLICRLVRMTSSLGADSDHLNPRDGWRARHRNGCADCQAYFAAASELDRLLVRQARCEAPPVPADLEQRIWQSVRPSLARPRPVARSRGWLPLAATAALAALTFAVVTWRGDEAADSPQVVEHMTTPTPADALAVMEVWSARLWDVVAPAPAVLTQDNPLQRELAAVQSDTRAAIRFIGRNFLPTGEADAPKEPVDPASSS
jgi:predicted anti-sigma-YlaC factor YlaD